MAKAQVDKSSSGRSSRDVDEQFNPVSTESSLLQRLKPALFKLLTGALDICVARCCQDDVLRVALKFLASSVFSE